jgi:hypothetical protein
VLRDEPFLPGPGAQKLTHGVVQAKETLSEIALEQQREIEQFSQQVLRLEIRKTARLRPKACDDPDGNVRILGEDSKLAEPLAFGRGQKIEADADRERHSVGALRLVAGIKNSEALRVESLVRRRDRDGQRLATVDAIAQKTVDGLEQERPLAEPSCQAFQARAFPRRLIPRQSARQQTERLVSPHRVDLLGHSLFRQHAVDPRRHQPEAMPAAPQEGLEVRLAPDVVDDHQNPAVAQGLAQLRRSRIERLELRPLAGEQSDEVGEGRDQALGLLAEFGPEDPVEIGVLDVGVARERLGERRLAIAAGAAQR